MHRGGEGNTGYIVPAQPTQRRDLFPHLFRIYFTISEEGGGIKGVPMFHGVSGNN